MNKWVKYLGIMFLLTVLAVSLVFLWAYIRGGTINSDCIWTGSGQAFLDQNKNGSLDPGELPLQGVSFHIDDTHNNFIGVNGSHSVTDGQGKTPLSVWLPGCPEVRFEVYADAPSGYQLTTPPRVQSSKGYGELFSFGFIQTSPITATITPTR